MSNPEEKFEGKNEQTMEEIMDILESAFEKGSSVKLTVSEPSGGEKTESVFIERLEQGILFVSSSKDSPVMGISIEDIKAAE